MLYANQQPSLGDYKLNEKYQGRFNDQFEERRRNKLRNRINLKFKNMKYIVYQTVNKINNKIYIGKTMKSFGDRWDCHRAQLNGGYHDNPLI